MANETDKALDAFAKWKAYPLPPLNADGQFGMDWMQREFVAFKAGMSAAEHKAPK